MSASRLVAACAALLAGTTIPAGACPQALASYAQAGSGVLLGFDGATAATDPMAHRFHVVVNGSGVRMDGVVMTVSDPVRPWGMVMHQCPEGDVTGAEIEACTVWEGEMRTVDASGGEAFLPLAGGSAAEAADLLRLSGFGAALARSPAWGGTASGPPTDDFQLKGCQE
ncbi:hypothetical protein DFR52_105313 [Hoeflea marina]|uniref:Uncharacterized protein n=1 Tax=Hoeflea marina TaxID=274592 RepID=A0A317PFA4_9HYPH|nr:hypothetical protein [Hoeflea marina]PWV98330.1 hypothetical protein DFR52_105313 [Hoeflea marina]